MNGGKAFDEQAEVATLIETTVLQATADMIDFRRGRQLRGRRPGRGRRLDCRFSKGLLRFSPGQARNPGKI